MPRACWRLRCTGRGSSVRSPRAVAARVPAGRSAAAGPARGCEPHPRSNRAGTRSAPGRTVRDHAPRARPGLPAAGRRSARLPAAGRAKGTGRPRATPPRPRAASCGRSRGWPRAGRSTRNSRPGRNGTARRRNRGRGSSSAAAHRATARRPARSRLQPRRAPAPGTTHRCERCGNVAAWLAQALRVDRARVIPTGARRTPAAARPRGR